MPVHKHERLRQIFDRTDGRCHICWGGLAFINYGKNGQRGAWEIEHSNPKCNGGTDRLNNLYAAHVVCNRTKGLCHTRTARAWNGQTCAPLSKTRRRERREENTWGLASLGAISGAAVAGPMGFLIGGIVGAVIGNEIDPD